MSDDQSIYPTHDCFTDALELFNELLLAAKRQGIDARPQLRLVHAVCKAPTGVLYSHAWIEDERENTCIFYGILKGQRQAFGANPIQGYREHHGVQELARYTYSEALRNNRKSGHYGPWVERIKALCSADKCVWHGERE